MLQQSPLADLSAVDAAGVESTTSEAIATADRLVDRAARATDTTGEPTFESTLRPLDDALAIITTAYGRGAFMGHVAVDRTVREAGSAADERLAKWRAELPFREDLYRSIRTYAETAEAKGLTGERRLLLDHWLRDFRRAGHELAPEDRAELRRLKSRLIELEVAFQRNIGEFRDCLEFTRAELDGLPDSYIDRLAPGSRPDTVQVTLDYPDVVPFMESARRRDLREKVELRELSKAVDSNLPVLVEVLDIRRRMAALLGYPSWAHYAMEVRMAGGPATVGSFYEDLLPALRRLADPELADLTAALRDETGDETLRPWDLRFYDTSLKRSRHGIDPLELAEYFPLEQVWRGLFEITGDVFGLDYREIEGAPAWHPDVRTYEIRDRDSGELLAYAHADLFPRDGKFTHAAAFQLVVAHRDGEGRRQVAVSAIVANLTPPSGDRPALLRHEEVVTLFHEFGHILHMSLSQAEFVRFSGAETESDFVEAPSQIMEHWTWDAATLRRFARHNRTGQPIPPELVERLIAARNLNVGIKTLRQLYLGRLDLAYHGEAEASDVEAVNREAYGVSGLPFHEGTFFPASFGHLTGGYDAGYYGYLWAKVFGDDMFSRFEEQGITDPEVGRQYRREILEPNGAAPAAVLLRRFLGREPSNAAFLRQLGLDQG